MRDNKAQFISLLMFLVIGAVVLSNGFIARIAAQSRDVDVFYEIQPIGDVLDEINKSYVDDPAYADVVEGAIRGMMNALDDHSAFVPRSAFERMTEDTDGRYDGIGVTIYKKDDNITVFQPSSGAPAAEAGIMAGDIIYKINDVSTQGMSLDEARDLIRGPSGTTVHLTLVRIIDEDAREAETVEVEVERGQIPIESIAESRFIEDSIGYIRLSDFKKSSADDIAKEIERFKDKQAQGLILDLRWNPGGLMSASKEVCELFLPRNTLVTYTRGRNRTDGSEIEQMRLFTERRPVVPETFPLIILVNEHTASSSEIVTGALQYWTRAIVVGDKTYGKGSVQTIIPLRRPEGSAIRLTTAHYYTPADVNIDGQGIEPDVEVAMSKEDSRRLWIQLIQADGPEIDTDDIDGVTDERVEDVQLKRAIEILQEDSIFDNLIARYHRSTQETQRSRDADQVASVADES